MLETELQKYGGNLKKLVKAGDIKAEAKENGFRREEELYLAIAQGRVTAHRLARKLLPEEAFTKATEDAGAITQLFQKIRRKTESPVLINGVEDVMVTYAQCCRPVPGENVTGFCYSRTRHHRPSLDLPSAPRPRAGASRPRPMARPGKGRHPAKSASYAQTPWACSRRSARCARRPASTSHGWRPVSWRTTRRDHPRGIHHRRR